MFRAIPTINKFLAKKWEEKEQKGHTERLNNIRSTLKLESPASYNHLQVKAKKNKIIEEQGLKINRENLILHEKIFKIERKPVKSLANLKSVSLQKGYSKDKQKQIDSDNE